MIVHDETSQETISSSQSSQSSSSSLVYLRSEEISIDTNRYSLIRQWEREKCHLLYIMLNPSSATDKKNDPTMRRCIDFANDNGYGCMIVVNLYPLRGTNPNELNYQDIKEEDIILNDKYIELYMRDEAVTSICLAWGCINKKCHTRALSLLNKLHDINDTLTKKVSILCLGMTIEGFPRHPLYIKKYTKFTIFKYKEEDIRLLQNKRKVEEIERRQVKKRLKENDQIIIWGLLNLTDKY